MLYYGIILLMVALLCLLIMTAAAMSQAAATGGGVSSVADLVPTLAAEKISLSRSSSHHDDRLLGGDALAQSTSTARKRRRRLLEDENSFYPLACNANLTLVPCQNWTHVFGADHVHETRLQVRCGECVLMDHPGPILTLRHGIEINGRLVFPDNGYGHRPLTVKAPLIAVQGELDMAATKVVDGVPNVQFLMHSSGDDDDQYFQPIDSNADVCGGGTCLAGKKAIVVAGGKLNFRGLPPDTPTWTHLYDVQTAPPASNGPELKNASQLYNNAYYVHPPPEGCPQDGVYLHLENFSSPPSSSAPSSWENLDDASSTVLFSGSRGSASEITTSGGGAALRVFDRNAPHQGPVVNITHLRHCLEANRVYLVTAKLRLAKEGSDNATTTGNNAPTACAATGEDCVTLKLMSFGSRGGTSGSGGGNSGSEEEGDDEGKNNNKKKRRKRKRKDILVLHRWRERKSHGTAYGETFVLATEFELTEDELKNATKDNAEDLVFVLGGPGPEVEMYLEEFTFHLPPPGAFPTNASSVCGDLVPGNGDAEIGMSHHPYPFYAYSRGGSFSKVVIVAEEDNADDYEATPGGNHYFQVTTTVGSRRRKHEPEEQQEEEESSANDTAASRKHSRKKGVAGLAFDVIPVCVAPGTTYKFHADVRVIPANSAADHPFAIIKANILTETEEGKRRIVNLAECPAQGNNGQWQTCEGAITITDDLVATGDGPFSVYFEATITEQYNNHSDHIVTYDIDNVSFVADQGPTVGLVLDASVVQGKWGPGAEVLITSHGDWDKHQVRTITKIEPSSDHGPGYVVVSLDEPFARPISVRDSPDYASEVALLSRNIVFEGSIDDGEEQWIGGHFWVKNTPAVQQVIEGVELVNFGQQGELGRYPIHFHLCGNVTGAIVAKNTVRQSNQRCIVVHGTNNLLVQENIAYDTKGHCFILEDGIEVGNSFVRNLGAKTDKPEIIIPDEGTNGNETDGKPSTFWITNPSNTWIGNVAAGSSGTGFWFELMVRGPLAYLYPDLKPKTEPLTLFRDNVAHGNRGSGIRTYPNGYLPDERAVFQGFKSYRNGKAGIFFHNSRNLGVVGGLFAHNPWGIDLDRADSVHVVDAVVVGRVEGVPKENGRMKKKRAGRRCLSVGLEMHTYVKSFGEYTGATFENVTFSGFGGNAADTASSSCENSSAFALDGDDRMGSFDYSTTLKDIKTTENGTTAAFNFCPAKDSGILDAYILDLDSSLKPPVMMSSSTNNGPSSLVSTSDTMLHFVDPSKCTTVPRYCYSYCQDTCFRSVRYSVAPSGTENFRLRLCRTGNSTDCVELAGYEDDMLSETDSKKHRVFNVPHPAGSNYDAVFLDGPGGAIAWPTFVQTTQREFSPCLELQQGGGIAAGAGGGGVNLIVPPISNASATCDNLIRNGDFDDEVSDEDDYPLFWYHKFGGVRIETQDGLGGSNALGIAASLVGKQHSFVQFLDTRCLSLREGRLYEIAVRVKLAGEGGEAYTCSISDAKSCPWVSLSSPSSSTNNSKNKSSVLAAWPVFEKAPIDDFRLIHGVVRIDEHFAAADRVEFSINRSPKRAPSTRMTVDGVSMKLLTSISSPSECGNNLVYNGGFDTGDSRFWWNSRRSSASIVDGSGDDEGEGDPDFALQIHSGQLMPLLRTGCIVQGELYEATLQYKLMNATGGISSECDGATPRPRRRKCPEVRLVSYKDGEKAESVLVAQTVAARLAPGWGTLYGIFTGTEAMRVADEIRLSFANVKDDDFDLVVDKLSVRNIPRNCDSLIVHSDMEQVGYNAQFWETVGGVGSFSKVPGVKSSWAIRYGGREKYSNGVRYATSKFMNLTCLQPGTSWEINARLKLVDAATGSGASCDPSALSFHQGCPAVQVVMMKEEGGDDGKHKITILSEKLRNYTSPTWNPDSFNEFKAMVNLPGTDSWAGSVGQFQLIISEFPVSADLVIDSFDMTRVVTTTGDQSTRTEGTVIDGPAIRASDHQSTTPGAGVLGLSSGVEAGYQPTDIGGAVSGSFQAACTSGLQLLMSCIVAALLAIPSLQSG